MPRDVRPTPVNEETPRQGRIAYWFETTIIRGFKRLLNDARETLRDILNLGVRDFVEDTEGELIELVRPFATALLDTPGIPENIKAPIREAMSGSRPAGLIVIVGLVAAFMSVFGQYAMAPLGRQIEQQSDSLVRSQLFDPNTLTALVTRGIISESEYQTFMAYNGLEDRAIQALKSLAVPLFDDGTLTQLLFRGEVSEGYVSETLSKQGYTPDQITKWLSLRDIIPSPTELVSMAVREAFSDSVAAQFGYDEDYPAEAAEWASKQGMDEVWFRRFWRAHWSLPGLVQVREMYNRGIIGDDILNTYLRAADLPSFWRESIRQWMKSEVTRVDVRRIYASGLITTEDVYQRYLNLGYNSDDAALMTQWTSAQYLEDERELTKSDILGMYEDGILNYDEASAYLSALDYRDDAIGLLLAHRDLKRQERYERQIIDNIKKLFIAGVYNATDVYEQLGKLDTPASFIEQSLDVWRLEQANKVSIPTVAQLRDMAQKGVIPWERWRVEMGNRGYSGEYISWYEQLYREET